MFFLSLAIFVSRSNFAIGSLLHGLTTFKNSDNSYSSFPWYNDGRTSLENHFSCEELFQPIIYFDLFIIKRLQLTYFEFLNKLPAFEHWQTSYLYHKPYKPAKVYQKSYVTVRTLPNARSSPKMIS
jgi:hypothetical protein